MILTLPYPPTVNTYWRHSRGGHYIDTKGVSYREDVVEAMAGTVPLAGRLKVWVRMHQPDARRRDVDNILKALCDALAHGGAYGDDSQIDDLRVTRKAIDRDNPRVIVTITQIGDGDE